MSAVYLIHFAEGLHVTGNRYAQHYIGFVENAHTLPGRMACHRSGQGSRLMRAVTAAGIDWHMVRMWDDGSRTFERQLKRTRKASMYCPVCAVERGHRMRNPRMPWRPERATRRELDAMRVGMAWWRSRQAQDAALLRRAALYLLASYPPPTPGHVPFGLASICAPVSP